MNRRTFFAAIAGLPFVRWFVPKASTELRYRLIRGGCRNGKTLTRLIQYGPSSAPYRVIPLHGKSAVQASLLAMYLNHTAKPGELEAKYAEAVKEAVIHPVYPVLHLSPGELAEVANLDTQKRSLVRVWRQRIENARPTSK